MHHNFIIRCYNRYSELNILLNQLNRLNINNIKLIFNGGNNNYKDSFESYYLSENRGYQLGELDLLNKSFELASDKNTIYHFLLTGCYIYNENKFIKYLNDIENQDYNLFIPNGCNYNFLTKESHNITNTYFVGGIISIKGKQINKLNDFDVITKKEMISNLDNEEIIKVNATDCVENYLFNELNNQFTKIRILKSQRLLDHFYQIDCGIIRPNRQTYNYKLIMETLFK